MRKVQSSFATETKFEKNDIICYWTLVKLTYPIQNFFLHVDTDRRLTEFNSNFSEKRAQNIIYVILYLYNWLNMWTLKEKLLFVCYSVFINDFLVIRIFKILKFINTTLKSIEYFKTWYDKRRIPILFQIIFFLCIFRDKIFLNPKYPSLVPCHASLKR